MSFAASSTGLRTGSRGATNGAALEAQRKEILRQNNPSAAVRGARGCAALLSCGCVRKHKRQESDTSMSEMPSARTLHGHIHDARDQPTPNANGTVRERRGRTKEQVRAQFCHQSREVDRDRETERLPSCFSHSKICGPPNDGSTDMLAGCVTHSAGRAKCNHGTKQRKRTERKGKRPPRKVNRSSANNSPKTT